MRKKQKYEKLNLCCLSAYRKTSPSGQHRFMQVFKLKAPTIWNSLFLFCLKLAKDIYLHESGRPATDVATERKKTPKATKPTHFPFLNIALSVVHCWSTLWSTCLNSETLRFITTHNIMIQDPTSVWIGFSPMYHFSFVKHFGIPHTGQKPMGFPHPTYTKVYSFYFQRCVIKTVD